MFKLVFICVFAATSLLAKPKVTTEYEFYDVFPSDKKTLEESMNETSPISKYESIRHGTVNWKVKYRYQRKKRGNICKIGDVLTYVKITYTMPQIAKNHKVSKRRKNSFNRYYQTLFNYLTNYKKFAVNAAKEIEKTLPKTKDQTSCEQLSFVVKAQASKIINKYKKENKNFAIRTFDGYLEGIDIEKVKVKNN